MLPEAVIATYLGLIARTAGILKPMASAFIDTIV